MLEVAYLNLRRWIGLGINPSAPVFEPHLWNDKKPEAKYWAFVKEHINSKIRPDSYHISYMRVV